MDTVPSFFGYHRITPIYIYIYIYIYVNSDIWLFWQKIIGNNNNPLFTTK